MNELITAEMDIGSMIYEIRGVQVMLDSDLAKLYECKNGTKSINLAVSRNIVKFPKDIYFQLTLEEYMNLKFQNETSRTYYYGGTRKLPYVFTEEGVAMLATVLHTNMANIISLRIIRAFVGMRKYISNNLIEQNYINNLVLEDHKNIKLLQDLFSKLEEHKKVNSIFFKGQIFDAYVVFKEICESAKEEIIIIDNYAGKELLKLLKDVKKKILIISSDINDEDINKYKRQYSNVEFKINNNFHDRFIIIDRINLYHSGASFKDLGTKCFAINIIEDKNILEKIIDEL
jgi:hypothetical protein